MTNKNKQTANPNSKKSQKRNRRKEEKDVGVVGKTLRALGGLGGSAIGGFVGLPREMAASGRNLGATLSKWLGFGDYQIVQNSILQGFRRNGQIPSMHRNGQSIIVRHKEYLLDITATTTTTPTAFGANGVLGSYQLPINPGLPQTFPWLSTIASQYQEYRIRGMVFHYVPTSGTYTANGPTIGSVMFATQYKAGVAAFTNKLTMLNEYYSSDSSPDKDFCHPIECDPKENPFKVQYVRTGAIPSNDDPKLYDLGEFNFSTENCPSLGQTCGELWISYEVELMKPVVSGYSGALVQSAHYQATATGVGATHPLGSGNVFTQIIDTFANFPGITFDSGVHVNLPKGTIGTYLIQIWWSGTTNFTHPSTQPQYNLAGTWTNFSAPSNFAGANSNQWADSAAMSAGGGFVNVVLVASDPTYQYRLLLGTGGTFTGSGTIDILVLQLNAGFI